MFTTRNFFRKAVCPENFLPSSFNQPVDELSDVVFTRAITDSIALVFKYDGGTGSPYEDKKSSG